MGRVLLRVLCAGLVACSPCEDPEDDEGPEERARRRAAAERRQADDYVHPARRCGECHTAIVKQWRSSAHAGASRSPLYRRMREHSGRDDCARCHEPLEGRLEPGHPALGEGVSCDGCHTQSEVDVDPKSAELTLNTDDNVRYGPICEAEDHYFHRVACKPVFKKARFCAGCHLWHEPTDDAGSHLPVYTEYEEWKDGPYGETDVPCQDCHMTERYQEIAAGWEKRYDISHHGLMGPEGELRQSALEMDADVSGGGTSLELTITLRNSGAGHFVPTGLPSRRIELTVRALDDGGEELDVHRERLGRVLVDGAGDPAPYYEAERVASDNRIPPRGDETFELTLEAPEAGTVEIAVDWLAVDPAIARRIGFDEPPERIRLLDGELRVGPPVARGSRRGLPAELALPR